MAGQSHTPIIYFNGLWIEANSTLLESLAPGLVRGRGVFETIAVDEGRMCFWPEHDARFRRGLRAYGLSCRFGQRALGRLAEELIDRNGLRQARLRVARYADKGEEFLVIVGVPMTSRSKWLSVQISPQRRHKTRYAHLKSIEYQPFYTAHQSARSQGYHEALLLNPDDIVVEGATTNVFFIRDGCLYTPAIALGCLNGIVRQQVIKLAPQIGLSVCRGAYRVDHLFQAEEVFMTNSLIGLQSVAAIDRRSLNPAGPLTKKLQQSYRRLMRDH